jgi:hypothetical protein
MFTSADTDSSGGLSKDEFSSMMDKLSAAPGRHGPHSAPPPPSPSEETSESEESSTDSTTATSRLDALFAAADTDGDGEVTLVEQEDALASMQGFAPSPFFGMESDGEREALDSLLSDVSEKLSSTSSTSDESSTTETTTVDRDQLIAQLVAYLKQNSTSAQSETATVLSADA